MNPTYLNAWGQPVQTGQYSSAKNPLDRPPSFNEPAWTTQDAPVDSGSSTRNLPQSMLQLNSAIQTPEDAGNMDIGTNPKTPPTPPPQNAKVDTTSGVKQQTAEQDATQVNNGQSGTTDSQKQTDTANAKKAQQDGQSQSGKQTADGQKAADGAQKNVATDGNENAGGAKAESPGQILNREVQETRQSMQNTPPEGGSGVRSSGGGGSPGNAENVLTQTSQKANMADQDHKRGSQMGTVGTMMEKKGSALEKTGDALSKTGSALSTAGSALSSTGESMLSNPFTAIPGAIMVAAGTALRLVGMALHAAGEAVKAAGKNSEKTGQKQEQDGGKLTKKASQNAQMGHQQLENLRNQRNGGGNNSSGTSGGMQSGNNSSGTSGGIQGGNNVAMQPSMGGAF